MPDHQVEQYATRPDEETLINIARETGVTFRRLRFEELQPFFNGYSRAVKEAFTSGWREGITQLPIQTGESFDVTNAWGKTCHLCKDLVEVGDPVVTLGKHGVATYAPTGEIYIDKVRAVKEDGEFSRVVFEKGSGSFLAVFVFRWVG